MVPTGQCSGAFSGTVEGRAVDGKGRDMGDGGGMARGVTIMVQCRTEKDQSSRNSRLRSVATGGRDYGQLKRKRCWTVVWIMPKKLTFHRQLVVKS